MEFIIANFLLKAFLRGTSILTDYAKKKKDAPGGTVVKYRSRRHNTPGTPIDRLSLFTTVRSSAMCLYLHVLKYLWSLFVCLCFSLQYFTIFVVINLPSFMYC